ncbi:MAG: hypothetical protein M1834_007453 [Cirrosporium novae-zelandiae]|nr:MAG: hypothetical protein M1834_007453 [Cirrosporium novae-zelandiae]
MMVFTSILPLLAFIVFSAPSISKHIKQHTQTITNSTVSPESTSGPIRNRDIMIYPGVGVAQCRYSSKTSHAHQACKHMKYVFQWGKDIDAVLKRINDDAVYEQNEAIYCKMFFHNEAVCETNCPPNGFPCSGEPSSIRNHPLCITLQGAKNVSGETAKNGVRSMVEENCPSCGEVLLAGGGYLQFDFLE